MNLNKLPSILANQPDYRSRQIKKAIYLDLISNWHEATPLPLVLRKQLALVCSLKIKAQAFVSADQKTTKALISLTDGIKIESVLMKQKDRQTICVSTQAGCPLGCLFCATGQMGFKRNLSAGEIVAQILFFARLLKKTNQKINRVVFMGMGEPFLNFENVVKAIEILNDPEGFNLGQRRMSVSSCGLPEKIKKFADLKSEVNLAISLHAPNDILRQKLMPIAQKHPLKKLFRAIDYYSEKTRRKVMFEYLLIKKINDQDRYARELGRLLKNRLCMVNLIAYNPTGSFSPSSLSKINRFKKILQDQGVETTQRCSFGRDIEAACGQLAIGHRTVKALG